MDGLKPPYFVEWFKTLECDKVEADIRNKLTPLKNLKAMLKHKKDNINDITFDELLMAEIEKVLEIIPPLTIKRR